jgi:hypothetical protein
MRIQMITTKAVKANNVGGEIPMYTKSGNHQASRRTENGGEFSA